MSPPPDKYVIKCYKNDSLFGIRILKQISIFPIDERSSHQLIKHIKFSLIVLYIYIYIYESLLHSLFLARRLTLKLWAFY